ncbi:hypothetical protein RN001_011742 [Aquatica leii]|uniref:Uncharacterized protein n=1 Tax=Aquatica leii TaxID=1421715 RepID=A0AAN7NXP5_9COLE|nr:hypothetical protein RN001_011742 [Aquatica leii]
MLWFLTFALSICAGSIVVENEIRYEDIIQFSFELLSEYSTIAVISSNNWLPLEVYGINGNHSLAAFLFFDNVLNIASSKQILMGFIINANTVEEVLFVKNHTKSNSTIVIITEAINDTTENYFKFFSTAWTFTLKNLVIVQINKLNAEVKVYAFNPFLNVSTEFNINQSMQIKKFLTSKNYHQYTIKATLFETIPIAFIINGIYMGIDPLVIETINQTLNVSIVTHIPYDHEDFGYRLKNGTMAGAIKELYSKDSDIAFNQIVYA